MGARESSTPEGQNQALAATGPISLKVIFVGDSSVGKTTLATRCVSKDEVVNTIGVEQQQCNTKLSLKGREVSIQIWDTAEQEKYKSRTTSYYRNVDGILLVYDITSFITFRNLHDVWLPEIEDKSPNCPRIMVANKIDLIQYSQVEDSAVKHWCSSKDMEWISVSAMKNENVQEALTLLATKILEQMETNEVTKDWH